MEGHNGHGNQLRGEGFRFPDFLRRRFPPNGRPFVCDAGPNNNVFSFLKVPPEHTSKQAIISLGAVGIVYAADVGIYFGYHDKLSGRNHGKRTCMRMGC